MGETINAYPFLIVLSVYTLTHSVTLCALPLSSSPETVETGEGYRQMEKVELAVSP